MAVVTLMNLLQWDGTIFDNIQIPSGMKHDDVVDAILDRCLTVRVVYDEPEIFKKITESWFRRHLDDFSRIWNALRIEYVPTENYFMTEGSHRVIDDSRNFDRGVTENNTENRKVDESSHSERDINNSGNSQRDIDVVFNGNLNTSKDDTENQDFETTSSNETKGSSNTKSVTDSSSETENQVSAFNASIYTPDSKSSVEGNSTTTTTGSTSGNENGNERKEGQITRNETGNETRRDSTVTNDDETHADKTDDDFDETRTTQDNLTDNRKKNETYSEGYNSSDKYNAHKHGRTGDAQSLIDKELEIRKRNIYDIIASMYEDRFCICVYEQYM